LLNPIYSTDAVAGIMSKGTLPPAPSTANLAGEYSGFSFGFEAWASDGFEVWTEAVNASVAATPGGYVLSPNDGDAPITLSNEGSYVGFADFSQHNPNSTGDFEGVIAFPITSTEVVFLRLEAEGMVFGPFVNYSFVNGEAGILSRDPNYQVPEFIGLNAGNGLPADFANQVSLGSGWHFTSWFGSYNTNFAPWVFHAEHGWLYLIEGDSTGFYLWDTQMESILWTSASVYPSIYRFSDSSWIFYQKGSSNPRWFVDLETQQWESW
jgi:hypothetical protein